VLSLVVVLAAFLQELIVITTPMARHKLIAKIIRFIIL
jgi:hypothetical protein